MRQPVIFISFLFFSLMLSAQDSLKAIPNFKNEVGISFRSDLTFSYFQLVHVPLNNSDLPDFFPKMDQLNEMSNSSENYFSNSSGGLFYTRWSDYRGKKNKTRYGLSFQVGTNDGYYFYDHWKTQTRTTFDSVVSQSSGTTYPVDSVFHQFYDRETKMEFLQLGIGGTMNYRMEKDLEIQFGIKGIFDIKTKESTKFKYSTLTTIETYGQHYNISRETATLQTETNEKTKGKLFSMSVSVPILLGYQFSFPKSSLSEMKERQLKYEMRRRKKGVSNNFSFRMGVEPLLTMFSMNNTFYCRPGFLFSYSMAVLF